MPFITTNSAPEVIELAHLAASHLLVLTPAQASRLLGVPLVIAMETLHEGQRARLFRAVQNPAGTGDIVYQPTAAALGMHSSDAPRTLQVGASTSALYHALLRAEIVSQDPGEKWLPHFAAVNWLYELDITQRRFAEPLVSFPPRRKVAYETVLPTESPDAVIRRVGEGWSSVLDGRGSGPILVRLAAPAEAVPGLQAALDRVLPVTAARRRIRDLQTTSLAGEDSDVVAATREEARDRLAAVSAKWDVFPYLLPTVLSLSM